MNKQQGFFISTEGGEGAGKTEMIQRIAGELRRIGYSVLITREPGGIPIAESIRRIILDPQNTEMDARTEAMLYAAARRQHLVEKVLPALEQGCVVICDRFIDSSLVYQGHARGLGIEEVLNLNQFATGGRFPDLTLYLDLDPKVGLQRIADNAGREVNRLDLESITFHQLVREGYKAVAKRYRDRIVTIDASGSPEAVADAAFQTVLTAMWSKFRTRPKTNNRSHTR